MGRIKSKNKAGKAGKVGKAKAGKAKAARASNSPKARARARAKVVNGKKRGRKPIHEGRMVRHSVVVTEAVLAWFKGLANHEERKLTATIRRALESVAAAGVGGFKGMAMVVAAPPATPTPSPATTPAVPPPADTDPQNESVPAEPTEPAEPAEPQTEPQTEPADSMQ